MNAAVTGCSVGCESGRSILNFFTLTYGTSGLQPRPMPGPPPDCCSTITANFVCAPLGGTLADRTCHPSPGTAGGTPPWPEVAAVSISVTAPSTPAFFSSATLLLVVCT